MPTHPGERTQGYQFTEQTPGSPADLSTKKLKGMIVQYEREFKRLTQQMADVHRQIAMFQSEAGLEKKKVLKTTKKESSTNRSIRRTKTCRSPVQAPWRSDRSPNKTMIDSSDRRTIQAKIPMGCRGNSKTGGGCLSNQSSKGVIADQLMRTPGYLSGSLGIPSSNLGPNMWNRSPDGQPGASQKLAAPKLHRDDRFASQKQSLLAQSQIESNRLPVKSIIKSSQRTNRIRGWKKCTMPVNLGPGCATGTMDHPQPPPKVSKSKDTPRDRSVISRSIIQTTPEDEDKRLARVSNRGAEEISCVRRSNLDDRESPRPGRAQSPEMDPEHLYQRELKEQMERWSQNLSESLHNELQRRYIVYEETISDLQSQIASDLAALDQLELQETETRRLAPRLTALSSKVHGDTQQPDNPLEDGSSESLEAQILALQQEIAAIESQNEILKSELLKRPSVDQPLQANLDAAAMELSTVRHSWKESGRLVQELRNAEERLSRAAAELETAEGQRRQLYEELTHCQSEAKSHDRPTVSSRLENSIPLEPSPSLIESRLAELLDSHNIMLALETRDVQIEHGSFDQLQRDWQVHLDRYSVLWQAEARPHLGTQTVEEMANELVQMTSEQTEAVLDYLLKIQQELHQKQALALHEIQNVLSSCAPGQNLERSSRRSTSESELFCISSAQKDVAEFDPKT